MLYGLHFPFFTREQIIFFFYIADLILSITTVRKHPKIAKQKAQKEKEKKETKDMDGQTGQVNYRAVIQWKI